MLKMNDLQEERVEAAYKAEKGENVTLMTLRGLIQKAAEEYETPVAFGEDQIKSGGMFNSTVTDCITMWHPDHPTDYFRKAITLSKQGVMYYVSVYYYGRSKQLRNQTSSDIADEHFEKGNVGRGVLNKLMSLNKNDEKMKEESRYYHNLKLIFDGIFG